LWEHWIFFDSELTGEHAALVVAHELGHIALHLRRDPSQHRLNENGRVLYAEQEEREADMFALCVLRYRPRARYPDEKQLSKVRLLPLAKEYSALSGRERGKGLVADIKALRALIRDKFFD